MTVKKKIEFLKIPNALKAPSQAAYEAKLTKRLQTSEGAFSYLMAVILDNNKMLHSAIRDVVKANKKKKCTTK